MGKSTEARRAFQRAIELAAAPDAKAEQQRAMAMSYAFAGDCQNTAKYEQMVFDYWVTQTAADPQNAWYQQGEMADEAARVCIDTGDLDAATSITKWATTRASSEPESRPDAALWEFRWEHAQARIAARRGKCRRAKARGCRQGQPRKADQAPSRPGSSRSSSCRI